MLQVIIRKKDRESEKAIRYLKERRMAHQTLYIEDRGLSGKEWESVFSSVTDAGSLVDTESRYYRENGYAWREYDAREELMAHPELLRTPIFRSGRKCRQGIDDEWIRENA